MSADATDLDKYQWVMNFSNIWFSFPSLFPFSYASHQIRDHLLPRVAPRSLRHPAEEGDGDRSGVGGGRDPGLQVKLLFKIKIWVQTIYIAKGLYEGGFQGRTLFLSWEGIVSH